MVIMLSDGGDNFNLDSKFQDTMKPYKDSNIPVYTIGMAGKNNFSMLKKISEETSGSYSNVKDVKDLKNTFVKIYRDTQQRLLNGARYGIFDNRVYGFLRVFFITLIAIIISAGISFMFDNKYLLKGFIIGGLIAGIIAGIILEIGFNSSPGLTAMHRGLSDIIIAVVFTLFGVSEVFHDNNVNKDNKSFSQKNHSDKNKKASLHSFD